MYMHIYMMCKYIQMQHRVFIVNINYTIEENQLYCDLKSLLIISDGFINYFYFYRKKNYVYQENTLFVFMSKHDIS